MVVVAEANEASQLSEVPWAWPTQYGLNFLLVHLDSLTYHMSEIEKLGHAKLTLGQLSIEVLICKYSEHHI